MPATLVKFSAHAPFVMPSGILPETINDYEPKIDAGADFSAGIISDCFWYRPGNASQRPSGVSW